MECFEAVYRQRALEKCGIVVKFLTENLRGKRKGWLCWFERFVMPR